MKSESNHREPAPRGERVVNRLDAQVDKLSAARLEHVRRHLARADVDALLICDPNDIFYVSGAKVPDEHQASRYYCIGHGLGMSGEWPNIPHDEPGVDYPLDGRVEPGMIICLESYVGSEESGEGVKLEDQFPILDDRVENMSTYPFDERLST